MAHRKVGLEIISSDNKEVGYVNIPNLIEHEEKDIQIAKEWNVSDIKAYIKRPNTEDTFRK